MKNFNFFNNLFSRQREHLSPTVKRQSRLMLQSGCSAVDVPMTSYGAPDEHPMSTRSASDGTRWNSRGWKYVACMLMLLVLSIGQMWGQTLMYTQGWENNNLNSWAKNQTNTPTIGSTEKRTGRYAPTCSTTGSSSSGTFKLSSTVSFTKNTYIHAIAYVKTSTATTTAIKLNGNAPSATATSASAWTRYTHKYNYTSSTGNKNVEISMPASSSITYYFDDVVIYYTTSNVGTDLTGPNAPGSASATTSSISWTRSKDLPNSSDSTGVRGTLIWRRTSGSSDDLTLNAQGIYSHTSSVRGPSTDQSGHWTLVDSLGAATVSKSGTFSAGDRYAIVHYDLAYNYSTPTYVTVPAASSCTAPNHVDISGRWDRFGGETISLTATAYSSAGTGSPIAAGSITGYQWQKLVGSTWTSLSNGTTDGVTISGATAANLQIANCGNGNSGKYRCVVSTGATCSTASATATDGSEGYLVRVYALEHYTGGTTVHNFTRINETSGSVQVDLTANTSHEFKIHGDAYFGNDGTITEDETTWTFTEGANNVHVQTYTAGKFTFTIDYSANGAVPVLKVAYPTRRLYLQLCSDWKAATAKYAIYYWRSATGWSDFMSTDACDGDIRYADIPSWAQNIIAVRFDPSKTSTGNFDSEWNRTGDLTLAYNKDYYHTVSKGGDNKYYGTWGTYIPTTYTIGYAKGSVPTGGGSISGSKSSESKTCGVDFTLPSSAVFTTTGYTQTGWTTSNGGAQEYALGGTYTTNEDKTFYPVWTVNQYSVSHTLTDSHATKTSGATGSNAATYNTDYTAEFAAVSGYTLPSDVTVTIGGTPATEDTEYTWDQSTGTVTITGSYITGNISITVTAVAAATCSGDPTALVSGTLYKVDDMVSNCSATAISSTTSGGAGIFQYGLSSNGKFYVVGTTNGDDSSTGTVEMKKQGDGTIDVKDGTFTYIAWFKNSGSTSCRSIKFVTPSAGTLIIYGKVSSSKGNIELKQGSNSAVDVMANSKNGSDTVHVAITAGATCYIWADGASAALYGIKFVETPACTAAPTVTAGSNSSVTSTTATVSCESGISSLGTGGCTIISYGFVIGTATGPTIGGSGVTRHEVGTTYTTTGTLFSKNLTGLTASTTYYVRPYATNGCGTAYGTQTSFTTTAAASLYTVTFNSNGGSAVSPATQASAGASIAKPSDPTRASYEFDGWYTTAGEKISWSYTPTADITLYARWEEECDAGGVAKSTADVAATGYTAYQEKGGSNVVFTSAPSLGFKYKDAAGNTINNSTTAAIRSNAYSCQIKSDSGNKGSIKTNSTFSNVDSISFYFAASDKSGCKIAVLYSTDNFSTDSTSLLSATTYGDSNGEFKRKTLAIPVAKKASSLTFKFRFTVTGAGKICYMDSLKVYSSTSGGGTCYHVYYHGNGADEGFVNDTVSYTAGSKATVLNYNYGRYPLTKEDYDFQGWATSDDGAVAYTAGQKIDITSADVDLYAKWATASSALVTWEKKVDVTTWTDNTTPSTTNPTNIGTIGSSATLIDSPTKNSTKTPQIQLASGVSNADKGASFTFSMKSADKVVVPTKVSCEVANVGSESSSEITYKAVLTDGAGNTYYSTNSICPSNNGTLNPIDFVFSSGLSLRGDITVKVYAWLSGSGSGFSFRMGPDIKFYGTVEDYVCADPSAPTISGVSEYVPGQTITLTASHDGTNYDNLTTYTWYKGVDWATASGTTPVQDAATGEDGYIFTKATCAAGDAGKYWCKVSNGTGCDAHNSEGYNIIVYPTYTITYNLNGGDWGEVEYKDSYTQFDEDYTLPTPTRTGFVFAGWYGKSDFSGLPTVVLGAGSVGNKEYWAKWGASVTVSWTVTKVDSKLYRGGGDYSVTAVIDQTTWNESYKDQLELTATEGVTLKNIVASVNGESKVQVTADFDITTDLAADATSITFTLNVPADGTYGPKVDEHEEDLTSCAGSSTTITIFDGATMSDKTDADDISYKSGTEYTDGTTGFKYKCANFKKDLEDVTEYTNHGLYSKAMKYGGNSTSYYISMTIPTGYTGSMEIVYGSTQKNKYFAFGTSNSSAANGSNGTKWNATTAAATTLYSATIDDLAAGTYYLLATGDKAIVAKIAMTLYATGGGVTPTLTWDDGDDDIATSGVSKNTSDNDFIYTARQDKNSLGAITYSSGDATVATVNATTGQVHLVGAAGTATITATIAASGCFSSASVSYTITVTDDCDDEAGTITTEDLGCSGIKMTVTGHTTTGETVSYQWYKDDVSLGSADGAQTATYTTTAAGEYYVIVTNSGDRHCAKRSTNTITVEAQAAATVAKIVDSWYVKKDRRTPDIELVKTTNATSFTVTNGSTVIWNSDGSNTTGFAGCGFRMDENGIIYLNGTKDGSSGTSDNADAPAHGDETWTAGDVTLTITAIGCGSNASQNITIHKQAATSYYDIAFVADGGKGMKKDSITVGHGDGTELYEYLDSVGTAAGKRLFQLSERNIYWTTDEKAIREEYSQFDAILITDDPSTNTVVKTGDDYKTKGYVNAFGTMVDVRPIFTMEAYVSALKNWGSKGIKGSPESPNPRQYEMRLECKDHEIYGAGLPDPEDGTNVWEEVIDGETFRHVIIVDSTKGVYKGVAYNAQTAGKEKPALQGFTGDAAGSLLGLGRISNGSLQAAIERQEEPAARLLVMGINAKALQPTCALTNEGKAVIKNILFYLLKTNMEEVDDCSNYFTGGASGTDTDWNKASNWSKNALPSNEAKVRILAPCVVKNGNTFHVAQVDIATSGPSSKKGSGAANGNLTIEAGGALIVAGKIRAAEAPYFAANDLKPTTPENLIIKTGSTAQAALIFDNEEGETQATVNYYSLGRKDGSAYQFQYFASPMGYLEINPAFAGAGIYTYAWDETIQDGWERRGYYTDVLGFEGLAITTKFVEDYHYYTLKGALASTADIDIALTYTDAGAQGQNLIGNSWTAPINIASLVEAFEDDANVTKTVNIYNSGNDEHQVGTAGTWTSVPIAISGWDAWTGLKVIPAMQAYRIDVTGETQLSLNYKTMVRQTPSDKLNEPLKAPTRRSNDNGASLMRLRMESGMAYTDLFLVEGDRFSEAFDNGYEAKFIAGEDNTVQFYAMNGEEKMAVLATDALEGTPVGFVPGKGTAYTISFSGDGMGYYLNDVKKQTSTLISEENTYSFDYEAGDDANRFYISATPFSMPQITTGMENLDAVAPKVQKVIYNDKMYIIRGGKVFSADGQLVK